jgi:predicted molibdopterin-dependent oxidoreductase YjgC
MFARLPDAATHRITIVVDGRPFEASRGDTVAAALLAQGRTAFRSTEVAARPRGPYCMMGVCFDCLVTIDGRANLQACMVQVEEGMRVDTQLAGRR